MPTSVAYIGTGQIMGWGNKAIEVSRHQYSFLLLKVLIYALLNYGPNRFVRLRVDIWTECLCIKKLNVWNSFANVMTRYSSAVPKVLRHVKSTLWHLISQEWLIGRGELLSSHNEDGSELLSFFLLTFKHYIIKT